MRGSHEKSAPQALTDWLAQGNEDWQPSYPFPQDIRIPVVGALAEAQRGLCVYCGRKLDLGTPGKSFHVEHFRPRSCYPNLEVSLANLFLSCGQKSAEGNRSQTCGTSKEDWFDERLHVEPDYPACTERFHFRLTGEIVPLTEGDAAAATMIARLRLNHPELKREREEIQLLIDGPEGEALGYTDFVDPSETTAESYAHMVCQRLGVHIP